MLLLLRRYTSLLVFSGMLVTLLSIAPAYPARAVTTITVNTTADLASPCQPSAFSLRCAFDQADKDISGDTIAFHIPAADPGCVTMIIQQTTVPVCTISPINTHFQGSLPALIVKNTTIDGYTQPGARPNTNPAGAGDNAIITIRVDGAQGGAFLAEGIQFLGSGNTIRGLSITNFNRTDGLLIDQGFTNTLAAHNTVAGNFLGIAPDGTSGATNALNVDLGIRSGASIVGGPSPADANVIGGGAVTSIGSSTGVYINAGAMDTPGAGANDVIQGNYIGTTAAGTAALGNGVGIRDAGGISITIGGTISGTRNVISGNAIEGVEADAGGPFGGVIEGNYIGTNGTGTAALGNGPVGFQNGNGVQISGSFVVGGTSPAARNVISGNANAGVAIPNGTINAVVVGNYIGTTAAGTAALGNGIGIVLPQDFQLAGATAHNRLLNNLISGNTGDGIADQSPSRGNIIGRNIIGLSATGAPLGNHGNGINLTLNGDLLRGPIEDNVTRNTIMNNGQSGVLVGRLAHSQISQNILSANGGLGIDLAPQGVVNCITPPPGPNDNTPCPVITTATTMIISGTACAGCTVEVFRASNEADDQGHGEGQSFLGNAVASTSNGTWSLVPTGGQLSAGQQVTASATTAASSTTPPETSEFGANIVVGS